MINREAYHRGKKLLEYMKQSDNSFSILEVWNKLLKEDMLYGYESLENFYHLTDLKIYKELLKNQ